MTERNRSLLVVEDDDDIRNSLVEALGEGGWLAFGAANGREALQTLRAGLAPAVILLDLRMPVMDGFTFRVTQLADPTVADIPVVIMSADSEIAEKAKQLGVEQFLPKPINLDDIFGVATLYCGPGGDGAT